MTVTITTPYRGINSSTLVTKVKQSLGSVANTTFGVGANDVPRNWMLGSLAYRNTISPDEIGAARLVNGLVDASQLPSYVDDIIEYDTLAALQADVSARVKAKIFVVSDKQYRWSGSSFVDISSKIESINGQTGVITLTKDDVGLSSIDNTSDLAKPISTATQNALNLKLDKSSFSVGIGANDVPKNWMLGSLAYRSGLNYGELSGLPTIPAEPVQSDWAETNTALQAFIKNKPTLPAFGTSVTKNIGIGADNVPLNWMLGSLAYRSGLNYSELSNLPSLVSLGTTVGTALQTNASAGDASTAARSNHVHPLPSKSDIGLGNVENTRDADKAISTLTQNALDNKEPTITAGTSSQYYRGDKTWQTLNAGTIGLGIGIGANDIPRNWMLGGLAYRNGIAYSELSGLPTIPTLPDYSNTYQAKKDILTSLSNLAVGTTDIGLLKSSAGTINLAKYSTDTQTVGANAASYTTSRSYPIQLDSNSNLVVNVPWADTNTTYAVSTGTAQGEITITPSTGSAYSVKVKDLGTAAYTAITDYLASTTTYAKSNSVGGSATTALKLASPVTINGVSFDGSQNITISSPDSRLSYGVGAGDTPKNWMLGSLAYRNGLGYSELSGLPTLITLGTTHSDAAYGDHSHTASAIGAIGSVTYVQSTAPASDGYYPFALGTNLVVSNGSMALYYADYSKAGIEPSTGNIISPKFIVRGGTSSQFLKADGSTDGTTYLSTTGTAASATKVANSLAVTVNSSAFQTFDGSVAKTINLKSGTNVSLSISGNDVTINSSYTDTNTTYSAASSTVLGLIKVSATYQSNGTTVNTESSTANRTYAVQLISGTDQAVVNVPWLDNNTTYTFATGTTNGTFSVTPLGGTATDVAIKGTFAGSSSMGGAATSVANKFILQTVTTGGTEGTSLFTFDGSTAKTVTLTGTGTVSLDTTTAGTIKISGAGMGATLAYTESTSTSQFPLLIKAPGTASSTGLTLISTNSATNAIYAIPSTGELGATTFNGNLKNKLDIQVAGTSFQTFNNGSSTIVNLVAGTNVTLSTSGNNITITSTDTNTTYTGGNGINLSGTTFNVDATQVPYSSSWSNANIPVCVAGSSWTGYSIGTGLNLDSVNKKLTADIGTASTQVAAGDHTHSSYLSTSTTYAGSATIGGAATSASKVTNSLKLQISSGTVEGTSQYTFDGSTAKALNITASGSVSLTASAGGLVISGTDTNTTYSAANSTTLGLVKVGAQQTVASNAISSTTGRTYAVQLDATNNAVVNVPWTDTITTDTNTTYAFAASTTAGSFDVTPSGASKQTIAITGVYTAPKDITYDMLNSGINFHARVDAGAGGIRRGFICISSGNGAPAATPILDDYPTGVTTTGSTTTAALYFDTGGNILYAYNAVTGSQGWKAVTTTDTNTTYSFATGTTNGTFTVTPSSGSATTVSIFGLGTAAYTASTAYAASSHTHSYAGSSTAGGAANSAVYAGYMTLQATPASATATGTAGQWAATSTKLYICTATNTWRSITLSATVP